MLMAFSRTPLQGTPVDYYSRNLTGTTNNRPFTVKLRGTDLSLVGSNLVFGTGTYQPTNGHVRFNLEPGPYVIMIDNVAGAYPFDIADSTNVYNIGGAINRGIFVYSPSNTVNGITIAGPNVTVGTANGTNVVSATNWTAPIHLSGGSDSWDMDWISGNGATFTVTNPADHGFLNLSSDGVVEARQFTGIFNGNGANLTNLPSGWLLVLTNGTVLAPWGAIDTAGTRTCGIQEAIDALPSVADIFSGVGGGKLVFQAGTFRCFTNVTVPNYFPFCLRMEGAGFNGSIVQGEGFGACTNAALFNCATNAINGLSISNALTLFVSDMGFIHTNQFQTNFLWNIKGQTFCQFRDCMFSTKPALLHGQGGYSLNYEANYPNAPIGLVGLAVNLEADNANCHLRLDHCLFYGLANGFYSASVIGHVRDSYFANCGMYNSTPPPANVSGTIFSHTNLWVGANASTYQSILSCGAAMVIYYNTPNFWVEDNVIFGCGAMAYVGTGGNGANGGQMVKFMNNYVVDQGSGYPGTSFHLLLDDTASVFAVGSYDNLIGPNGLADSAVTNSASGRKTQPNGVAPGIPPPELFFSHSGSSGNADGWFEFKGQRMIGNGSGLTNVNVLPAHAKASRPTPSTGMMIFQSDNTPGLRVYNGSHWVKYSESNDD